MNVWINKKKNLSIHPADVKIFKWKCQNVDMLEEQHKNVCTECFSQQINPIVVEVFQFGPKCWGILPSTKSCHG